MNGTDGVTLDQSTYKPIQLDQSTFKPLDQGGAQRGFLGGALLGSGGQGGLLPGLSPVPASWLGQMWDAVKDPAGAGLDLLKRGAVAVGSEVASPVVSAYNAASALKRGDLAEAAKQYARAIPGVAPVSDLAQGMWGGLQSEAQQAQQAQAAGDTAGKYVHAVASALPVVGPQGAEGWEQFRRGLATGDEGAMGAGLGQMAAVPLSFVAPELAEKGLALAGRLSRPAAGTMAAAMSERLGPEIANNMTRAEMVDAAKRMNVNLPLGKATGSPMVQKAEAVAENSLFGASRMEQLAKNNQAALNEGWDALIERADPGMVGTTPELTGRNLNEQGDSIYNVEKLAKDTAYQQMAPAEPDIPDVRLNELEDFGRRNLFHPKTGKPIGMPDDLRQAYMQALDIRYIGKHPTTKLMGSVVALPEAAAGAGGVRPDLSAALPAGATVAGVDGDAFNLKTAGGDMPGVYRVVEADDVNASHNPRNFAVNPNFPAGVQERAYHLDRGLQALVEDHVNNFDPAFVVNTNPDAINGPTVTLADGKALAGTNRYLTVQRLYDAGLGDLYRDRLMKQAAQFGIDPAQIAGMKRPLLVRQLAEMPATVDEARRIASDLNRPFTAALSPEEMAVSRGRSITPDTLKTIGGMFEGMGDDANLNDLLRSKERAANLWSLLERDGVVTRNEAGQYWDQAEGNFTPEGQRFVRNALLGSAVNDVGVLRNAPPMILGVAGRPVPEMSRLMARGDEWDITPVIQQALAEHANLNAKQLTVADWLRQRPMFGERNPLVDTLVARLAEKGPGYRKALQQFASDAAADVPGQGLLAGAAKPEAWRSFNDAFGTALNKQGYKQALDDAKNGDLNGIQSGTSQQVPAAGRPVRLAGGRTADVAAPGIGGSSAARDSESNLSGAQVRGDEGLGAAEGAGVSGAPGGGAAGGGAVTPEIAGGNVTDWYTGKHAKSEWFDKSRNFSGNIRDAVAGAYAKMVGLIQPALTEAARGHSPATEQQWLYANGLEKQLHEDWNSLGSDLAPTRNTPPGWLANLQEHYLAQGKAGGSPERIQALIGKNFDLGGLRQQALQRMASRRFSVAGDKFGGFSDEFLRTLFFDKPELVDDLYKFGAVKHALNLDVNPSGSGKLLLAGAQAGQIGALAGSVPAAFAVRSLMPVLGAAGTVALPYLGARAVTSPEIFEYLTQPRGAIGRAISPQTAAGWRLAQFLKPAQDQNQGQ